jgi:uncharacterized protein YjbJ (UPF0337 family)
MNLLVRDVLLVRQSRLEPDRATGRRWRARLVNGDCVMEVVMNADVLKGKWLQVKGSIKEKWGQLTDDDLNRVSGNVDRLIGLVQERYGYQKEEAQRQVNAFLSQYDLSTR